MKLAKNDGEPWNDWLLVGGERLQHIATGKYLSSASGKTFYAVFKNASCPWEQDCEYDHFGVRPGDGSDAQRWLFERGVQVKDGSTDGAILRHFKDGMVADISRWILEPGRTVGHKQHFAHPDYCKG